MKNTAKKKEILYAAYRDERPEDGLNYAIYLAGLLGTELRVILLERDNLQEQFDNLISAITFVPSEGNKMPQDTVIHQDPDNDVASLHLYLTEKCRSAGVSVNVHSGFIETPKACLDFIGNRKICMVLLSPSVTESGKVLNYLIEAFPQPVVTMRA